MARDSSLLFKRYFSPVRQLDWCDSGMGLSRKMNRLNDKNSSPMKNESIVRVPLFGIICAMSSNRVIGVNGKLPWRISEDFAYFKSITRDKVVILGRLSYEENEWKHTRKSIVVSSTLEENLVDTARTTVVRSFDEALNQAMKLANDESIQYKLIDYDTSCKSCSGSIIEKGGLVNKSTFDMPWVLGGERIFEEALRHPAADELHLTKVQSNIDLSNKYLTSFARFPPKYRWDTKFKEVQKWDGCGSSKLNYSFHIYKRIR